MREKRGIGMVNIVIIFKRKKGNVMVERVSYLLKIYFFFL